MRWASWINIHSDQLFAYACHLHSSHNSQQNAIPYPNNGRHHAGPHETSLWNRGLWGDAAFWICSSWFGLPRCITPPLVRDHPYCNLFLNRLLLTCHQRWQVVFFSHVDLPVLLGDIGGYIPWSALRELHFCSRHGCFDFHCLHMFGR